MNTGLNFPQYAVDKAGFSISESAKTSPRSRQQTFAELSHQDRISTVADWLYEHNSHSAMQGNVSFNTHKNNLVINYTEDAINVCENADWLVAVPIKGEYPAFSTVIVSKKSLHNINALPEDAIASLANILAMLSTRYDNLMMASVGLSIDWYSSAIESNHLHAIVSPIASSETGIFGTQPFIISDFTAEQTARRLRNLSDIHYRDIFSL